MKDIKACAVCFCTKRKLYSLNEELRAQFNTVSGLKTWPSDGTPGYLCWECRAFVKKFYLFRSRCHRARYALQQIILKNDETSVTHLLSLNRHKLNLVPTIAQMPTQQYVTGGKTNNVKITQVTDQTEYRTLTEITLNPTEPVLKKIRPSEPSECINNNNVQTILTPQALAIAPSIATGQIWREPVSKTEELNQLKSSEIVQTVGNEKVYYYLFTSPWYVKEDRDTEVFEEMLSHKDDDTTDQEYAWLMPITSVEAKAAAEVLKFTSKGKYVCGCGIRFRNIEDFNQHFQKHNMFKSGEYRCEICKIYFKSDFMLGCHYQDNHIYKFVCKICPEVHFTRASAKHHYIVKHMLTHIDYGPFEDFQVVADIVHWSRYDLETLKKRMKSSHLLPRSNTLDKKLPGDYLVYSPISQEEQYEMVLQRRTSRNYLEAPFRCHLCYRGYRLASALGRHSVLHDPKKSGPLQCDMCKLYFHSTRKMYKHMTSYHLYKYSCKRCDFVCTSKYIALYHYSWQCNLGYQCPHCPKKFVKFSALNAHISLKHPRNELCNMCGKSFLRDKDLRSHQKESHSKEDVRISKELLINTDKESQLYCAACQLQFYDDEAFSTHLASSSRHFDPDISTMKS